MIGFDEQQNDAAVNNNNCKPKKEFYMQFAFYRIIALLARLKSMRALLTSSICGVARILKFNLCLAYVYMYSPYAMKICAMCCLLSVYTVFFRGRFEVLIALFLLPSMNNKLSLLTQCSTEGWLLCARSEQAYYPIYRCSWMLEYGCIFKDIYLVYIYVSVKQTSLLLYITYTFAWADCRWFHFVFMLIRMQMRPTTIIIITKYINMLIICLAVVLCCDCALGGMVFWSG